MEFKSYSATATENTFRKSCYSMIFLKYWYFIFFLGQNIQCRVCYRDCNDKDYWNNWHKINDDHDSADARDRKEGIG